MEIKLIAFDLDGTALDSNKNIPHINIEYLEKAAEKGIHIVPSTGRFYKAIPDCIRTLPFVRYAITINGSEVVDTRTGESIYGSRIPLAKALELLDMCESLGVAYDCYVNNLGYMSSHHIDNIEDYLDSPVYCDTVRKMRIPVEDLREFVKKLGADPQKIQLFTRNIDILKRTSALLNGTCPDLIATTSLKNNLEINNAEGNKGEGLRRLASYLNISMDEVMAVGDGGNDATMLSVSGVPVAMENGLDKLKQIAVFTTLSNDDGGLGYAIKKLIFKE